LKLLAVDTALGGCSVALLDGDHVIAHLFEAMDRGHAERLAPMVDEVMRGHDFGSLTRLAVTVGPGTFTGQRVGLAFMRGLRLALQIPLAGATTLEAMAAATQNPRAAAIHDARRAEAYLLLKDGAVVLEPSVMSFAAAIERIRAFGPCALAGTGAPAAQDALGSDFTLTDIRQPDALWVARLAMAMPVPDAAPGPLYLRAPDAKLPGGRSIDQPSEAKAQGVRPEEKSLSEVVEFSGDPAPLAALHAACFPDPWDAKAIAALLATPGTFAFQASLNGRTAEPRAAPADAPDGFVMARTAAGEAEILTLAVAPAARGKGLGRALLQAAISKAQAQGAGTMFLEVGADNPSARALYASLGFVKVGDRKGYYQGRDALVLRLPLAGNIA
jgi:tRNA threonylcarbamoyladenosine biosynthesis protein TsaB